MSIQIQGNGGVVAEVDGTLFRALRVTARPVNYGSLGIYKLGMESTTMAAALAANSEMFQFRWSDAARLVLLYNVEISAAAIIAATAAAGLSFNMALCRGWSAAGSGGTRAVLTGNISKLRTSMGTSLVNDAGISSTGALTAGTKTIDHATTNFGSVALGVGTAAITAVMDMSLLDKIHLFEASHEGHCPVVFVQNEGFIIRNGVVAWPATMTWKFCVETSWAEVDAF